MNERFLLPAECFRLPPAESWTSGLPMREERHGGSKRQTGCFFGKIRGKTRGLARKTAMCLAVALALWWLGNAGYIHAKAWVGQALLERAWKQTQQTQTVVKPWPWADTVPVARLSAQSLEEQTLILRGANGRTIAWGPGWREDSAPLGTDGDGNRVIIAHRDTHFRFLKDLTVGDVLGLENAQGKIFHYRVWRTRIVDADFALPLETEEARLTLVTCYPFDALARENRQRYLVEAVHEAL
ncbi:MAG: class GN sortase [Burkholderiales bacterium]|jgi:sortase A|nr:class GN sortase [Burkholderiales bacterium]